MPLRQLSLLTALALLLPTLVAAQPAQERLREPPSWPSAQDYQSRTQAEAGPPARSEPGADVETALQPETAAVAAPVGALPAFTVQLAAFQDLAGARAFARNIPEQGIQVLATSRDGVDWYSVVLGLYETRPEAALAQEAYQLGYPGTSTWLRSTGGLRRMDSAGD